MCAKTVRLNQFNDKQQKLTSSMRNKNITFIKFTYYLLLKRKDKINIGYKKQNTD